MARKQRGTRDRLLDSFSDTEEICLDKAFHVVGEFGTFQKRVFLLVLLYQVAAVFHTLLITFVGLDPNWDCTSNGAQQLSHKQKCSLYESTNNKSNPCTNPQYTDRFHSLSQEFDLICGESYKVNLTQSYFFLGFLIGSYVLGYLADQIGRKRLVIGFLVLLSIVQLLTAFSPNYTLFSIGRFLTGFLVAGGITFYVLVCEVIGSSQRSLLAVCTSCMFAMGFGCLSLSAYVLPYWRGVVLIAAIGTFSLILFSKYIPESPRWLYVKGHGKAAELLLMNVAHINGRSLPLGFALESPKESLQSPGIRDIFRHGKMRRRMIIQLLEWFTVCMTYYGLSLGVGKLSDNLYLAFTLSGLVELPSNLIALFALEKIGRKWSNTISLLIGGVASLSCAYMQFIEPDPSVASGVKLGLSLLGKFAIAASFTIIFTYTPELIPTDMRNFGMGIANVCARFGGIMAPLVILLDTHVAGLSMLIMGSLSVLVSVLCLYLPETLNNPLPSTLRELV